MKQQSAIRSIVATTACGLLCTFAGLSSSAMAERTKGGDRRQAPLMLSEVGSFFVGGRQEALTATETGIFGPGTIQTDQMYVQYMLPAGRARASVVMIHGAGLTGKSYETTPDGRMGWYEYFARKHFGSYIVDQVGRGRSGFNPALFNDVRAGLKAPGTQPNVRRLGSEIAAVRFRIKSADGYPFKDTKFPVDHIDDFARQGVPDLTEGYPPDNPNIPALSELVAKLNNTVLIAHSQAGRFPFETALVNPQGISGIVAVEPGGCNASVYTDEQVTKLAKIPTLVIFGDHLDAPQTVGIKWDDAYTDCRKLVARITAKGGRATIYYPPDHGIHGNSHMIMQDSNNLAIADYIIRWIDEHVADARPRGSRPE